VLRRPPRVPTVLKLVVRLAQKWETAREKFKSEGLRAVARHAATKLWRSVRKQNASVQAPWEIRKEIVDASFDKDRGINTGGTTHLHGLHVIGPYRRVGTTHIASDPDEFAIAIASLDIEHKDFTFIDLGSGKGRALILALSYPFRRIVGVEFALELHRTAEANLINLAANGTEVGRVELFHADVTTFQFPEEPSVIYLYNPFEGDVMRKVIQCVLRSHATNPRPIFVLYTTPLLESYWTDGGFTAIKRGSTFSLLVPPNPPQLTNLPPTSLH
jgi:SAM-dependent methyltransferase